MKKVYIRSFGWPKVTLARDGFGVVEEDKWFGLIELRQNFGKITYVNGEDEL
jgi:hypothetical protein